MLAKKCDKCGKFYAVYNDNKTPKKDGLHANGFIYICIDENQRYYRGPVFDMCPECMKELVAWFSGGSEVGPHA